jgi:hypothetical protein
MKRMIYQVCLGKQSDSKLYDHCIRSVQKYCQRHNIEHVVQYVPKLKIKPDVIATNRSNDSYMKHGGFLPIFEKENAFDMLDDFDQIAIIDADIYIREDAPNIFKDLEPEYAWGSVVEREMPITEKYGYKIKNYSNMQYHILQTRQNIDFKQNNFGYEFFNMGMIVINTEKFKPYLNGQNAKQFITRLEFKDFVDGQGPWKWSTDQTLLNYFLKKYNVPTKHMSYKWNGLYGVNTKIEECHFVHFFLKDHLPDGGENVEELMKDISL